MKFNRKDLMKTVQLRIDEAYENAHKEYSAALDAYEDSRTDWLASNHRDYFIRAAETLAGKARAGLVTPDDLDAFQLMRYGTSNAQSHVFFDKEPCLRKPDVADLRSLLSFLNNVLDEEVSSSGLADAGFRNLASILKKRPR